jgi:hypothetical protein
MHKLTRPLAAVGAAIAAAAALVGTAQATPSVAQAITPHAVMTTTPMKVTGYDPEVAKANGYEIRTDPQGRQYSVKVGTPTGGMTPANEVSGNCGVSWIYEVAQGGLRVSINTGFHVIAIAVSFEWKYWMGDQGGVTSHTHSGPLSFTDWHTPPDYWSHLTAGSASSWWTPQITPGRS